MAAEGKKKAALLMCLFWAMAAAMAYLLLDTNGRSFSLEVILFSLLFLILGLIISTGRARTLLFLTFFPVVITHEDLDRYDTDKVSLFVGVVFTTVSCALLFISVSAFVMWMAVGIAVVTYIGGIVYVLAAKRFRVNA